MRFKKHECLNNYYIYIYNVLIMIKTIFRLAFYFLYIFADSSNVEHIPL